MWTIEYIFSQICMALAILMLGITYFLKSKKVIWVYSTVGALMFAAHYFLLGSYVGFVLNILAVIRGIWFYCNEAASKKSQVVSFVVIMIANLIIGIFTLKSWLDVLAIVACLLYTFAVWQKSILHYKWSAIVEIICWIIYNAYLKSIIGILSQSALFVSAICGLVIYYVHKHKKNLFTEEVNENKNSN